ncbi:MAG TPA: hypothetical protein VFC86_06180 [Planctomycetota bacterium]|nr:hypothetical protein [Planctomycetota bacterium]
MKRVTPFVFLVLAAAAVGGTGYLLFSYSFRRGETFAEGSSYRATKDGLRALALLLEQQGHSVDRLTEAWTLKDRKGVFISNAAHHAPAGGGG